FADEDGELRFGRDLLADERAPLAPGERPAHAGELALEGEDVTRLDDALETTVADAGEERDLARVRGLGKDRDRAGLSARPHGPDARHRGPSGEMARKPPVVRTNPVAAEHALSRI